MTYDEALQALRHAQQATWYWDRSLDNQKSLAIHDGITLAIEVFERMKTDLEYYKKLGWEVNKDGSDKKRRNQS